MAMKLSISKALIGSLAGLQFIAVSIFLSSSYISTEEALINHARTLMEEVADDVIMSSKNLLEPAQDVASLTKSLILNGTLNISKPQVLSKYLFEQLRIHNQISGIYFGTQSGDFYSVQHNDEKQPNGYRTKIITNRGGVRRAEFNWHDEKFNVTSVEDAPNDTYDPRKRPWYTKAVAEGRAIWTDPYIFFTAREPGITSAVPVYGDNEKVAAVVGVDVKITSFSKYLKQHWNTENSGAFIVSTNGTLVATTELANGATVQGPVQKPVLPNIESSANPVILAANNALKAPRKDRADGGSRHSIFTSFDGEGGTHFATFAPFEQLPWAVGLYGSEEHYLGDLKDNQILNLLLALAAGVLACFAGLFIAYKLSKPIKQLGRTARSVSREGLDANIEQNSGSFFSEIQDTTEAFTRMMSDLKEAEKSKQALSDFISSMSHELRTPMNAITGFSQLLQNNPKEPLTQQQNEYTNIVVQSSEHLLELINRVLDLAKIQSGTMTSFTEKVNPRHIIDQCINILQFLADKHNVELKFACDGMTGPNMLADSTRLKQVMLNLISNAIKYNHEGGCVSISFELAASPDMMLIKVSDTGTGIPKERIDELFEPFNRLGNEGTSIEGTGIGLSITKDLVNMMGGSIGVKSEHGVGSTFWVEIPVDKSETEQPMPCRNHYTCDKRSDTQGNAPVLVHADT